MLLDQRLTMTVMGCASLGTCRIHRLDGKRLECTSADQLQAGRTEAILKTSGNPVHLLFGNSQPTAPTLVPATLERLSAVLARLIHCTSQNSTPGCALMPFRKGCLICFISVTRSASSINASLAPRPVITTCCMRGRPRRTGNTSSSRT